MLTIDCPKCRSVMIFDSSSGTFICHKCNAKVSVTELNAPQLGSSKRSVYYPDKAANNIYKVNSDSENVMSLSHSDINLNDCKIISCNISAAKAVKKYKKWSRHGLFSPHSYNKEFRQKGLELKYVPAMLYSITGHGVIELTGNKINETVKSKERRVTTDYYGIKRSINTNYLPYPQFSDKYTPGPVIMNSINDYSYDKMHNIQSNEDRVLNADAESYIEAFNEESAASLKLPESVINGVISDTESELHKLVTGYSSTYVESVDTDYTINSTTPVLLPVWTSIHEHGQIENNFYMNGQTGTISGRPAISKFRTGFIIILISLILSLAASYAAYSISAAANEYNYNIKDIEPVIDDKADILSEYEEVSILDYADKQKDVTGYQYVFATADSSTYTDKEYELQTIYARLKSSITAPGTVLFLIGTDGSNIECALQGYKAAKEYLPRDICDSIESSISGNSDGSDAYDMAMSLFDILDTINDGKYTIDKSGKKNTEIIPVIVLIVLVSVTAAAAFIVIVVLRKKKNNYTTALTYTTIITEQQDIYLRTVETLYKL